MTRRELQQLARMRLREAGVLLRARQYSGAYYLCGYAVECALKACIAKRTRRYDFPDRVLARDAWTHDLDVLLRASDLKDALDTDIGLDQTLARYWTTVRTWRETSRYQQWTANDAQNLYEAVSGETHGVLQWLRQHW